MKIAMIGQKGMPARFGGVERHVHDLAIGLSKAGFDVSVYNRAWYGLSDDVEIDGVRLVNVPSLHTKHLDTITHTLIATIHAIRQNFDVIHYHGVGPSLWSWMPRLFAPRTTVVTTFHSIDRKHEKWGLLARLMLRLGEWTACRFAHRTVAVSQTIRQYVRDVYDCDAAFVPNAVPMYEKSTDTSVMDGLRIAPQSYILIVTRLIPHKGVHYAIDAFKHLQHTNPDALKDTKLVIVGDGYYTDDYVYMLREKAFGNSNIVFTGFQSGEVLRQLFSHAKFMLHPSDKEGMAITVLEGMSYGLPVLLSDIPEHLEFAPESEYLFARGQVKSLSDRMATLLSHDASKRAVDGQKNRVKIAADFTWDTVLPQMIATYHEARGSATHTEQLTHA